MKYFVCSDIHGSAEGMNAMLQAYAKENPDCLILLGDILHGWDNDEDYVASALRGLPGGKLAVRGNCDYASDEEKLGFPLPEARGISFCGKEVHMQHHPFYLSFPPGTILLFGHTHRKELYSSAGVISCNPGSIGSPRDDCASYAILDGQKRVIQLKDLTDGRVLESLDL